MGKLLGYARISKREEAEHLENQRIALREAGVEDRDIFEDVISGAEFERPGLTSLKTYAREGDTIVMQDITRLGRTMRGNLDLVSDWNNQGVYLSLLNFPMPTNNAMMAQIFITFLSMFAEMERDYIIERSKAGQERARAEGKRVGGMYAYTRDTAFAMERALERGETAYRVHKDFNIARGTANRFAKKYREGVRVKDLPANAFRQ